MKRTILSLAILISISAAAQSKDSVILIAPHQITDSTALIQVRDIDELYKDVLGDVPAKYTDIIRGWINSRIQLRAKDLYTKNLPPKPVAKKQ